MIRYGGFLTMLVLLFNHCLAQKNFTVTSPNKKIAFHLRTSAGAITYQVTSAGKLLITNSNIGLDFSENKTINSIQTGKPGTRRGVEEYDLLIGKNKNIRSEYEELSLPVRNGTVSYHLIARVFNDGIGFRYEFKSGKNDSFELLNEKTEFQLHGNPVARTLLLPNFTSSHEGHYSRYNYADLPADTLIDMPALFEWNNGNCLAITEAALLDYAGMYLIKSDHILKGVLSPLPNRQPVKVVGKYPHHSPWRVLMIGDSIGTLIESNIITDLNAPPVLKNTDWIKPGKTTFPWWNGNVMPDTINAPGNNFVTQKYYIDFCARNNIEYHTVVEYGLHQWYVDDGAGFQPGPNNNVTQPVPGLDMKEVCDYAATKGVGVRVWVHWAALYPRIDSAFAIFERWGLKGMMIDFLDRDDQEMINIQTEMLEKAAKHHLHVQFHGVQKPTGLTRTYPNELTREGALNYEYNKWGKIITADHDLNIIFTRMLAGPTDYHMGGFRFVQDSAFRAQYTRPLIISTKAHMLALYVVMENYLGMVADFPEAYEGKKGFDFISAVPTVWDKTRVVAAKTDEYAVIARKKDEDWWLGAINNLKSRDLVIPLSFLGEGSYRATIYSDDNETLQDPNQISITQEMLSGKDMLKLTLAGSGGAAIRFEHMNP